MNKVVALDANRARILPRCNPTKGYASTEVILLLTPDQPGYAYTKAKIQNAMGASNASR